MTKFISGASDYIAGAICADADFIRQLMDLHTGMLMVLGPAMDPQLAFNISLRIPHLPLRMTEHSNRIRVFAERLHAMGMTEEDKNSACVSPGLVRMSVGYTGTTEQRWNQLQEALHRVGAEPLRRKA